MNCEKKQIEDSNFIRSLSHSFYYQETVSLISVQDFTFHKSKSASPFKEK